MEKVIKRKRN